MTAIIKKFFENDNVLVFNKNNIPGVGDIPQIEQDIIDLQTNKADKLQNNLIATTDPTVSNDDTEGYSVLSVWINNSTSEIFKCLDNTTGASVWIKTSLTIDELGSMALEDATNYYTKTEVDGMIGGGGVGFYYDNINHKLEDKIALQAKLNDDSSDYMATHGNYVFYSNRSDGSKLYRINIDGTNRIKLNDDSSNFITTDGTYVFYGNESDGSKLYRINIDGTNRIKLNDDSSYYITTDGTYVFYSNNSDSGRLYRINIDGTNIIKLNDDYSELITTDGTYVFYSNSSDGYKLYRINIDGTNRIKLNDDSSNFITTDGTYVFYGNINDGGNKLYRINIDGTNRIKLNDDYSNFITTDGTYVFYSNNSDSGRLYRINIDGTNRTKLNDDSSSNITTDGTYVFYGNGSDGYKLYKSEINNIIYFLENDNTYESEVIENNSQEIYIKSYQNIPLGTDYTFSLANAKVENIVIPEGDIGVYLMGISLNTGMDYNLLELFNVGDIIILYKTGESDIQVEISNVNPGGLQFTTDTGKSGDSWGIKGLVQNYEIIPNTSLDGKTKIDLLDLFGTTTEELYYKIELESDTTKTKTSTINSIEILK